MGVLGLLVVFRTPAPQLEGVSQTVRRDYKMADAPVNVYLADPTEPVKSWSELKDSWVKLNSDAHGNREFNPLTIKAFYVFGVQLAIFRCVSYLLEAGKLPSTTYLPAYGLFASGIELLGRCLRGNKGTRGSNADLIAGLQWLSNSDFNEFTTVPIEHQLVCTMNGPYSIQQLAVLREMPKRLARSVTE
jgi:hypothetical protein